MTLTAKFTATYIAPCGDSYEIENCYSPRVALYCTDCMGVHYYEQESITQPLMWDDVMDDEVWGLLQSEGFIEEIDG